MLYKLFLFDFVIYYDDINEEYSNTIISVKEDIKYKLGSEQLKDLNKEHLLNCKQYDEQLQYNVSKLLKNDLHKSCFSFKNLYYKIKNIKQWFN